MKIEFRQNILNIYLEKLWYEKLQDLNYLSPICYQMSDIIDSSFNFLRVSGNGFPVDRSHPIIL